MSTNVAGAAVVVVGAVVVEGVVVLIGVVVVVVIVVVVDPVVGVDSVGGAAAVVPVLFGAAGGTLVRFVSGAGVTRAAEEGGTVAFGDPELAHADTAKTAAAPMLTSVPR